MPGLAGKTVITIVFRLARRIARDRPDAAPVGFRRHELGGLYPWAGGGAIVTPAGEEVGCIGATNMATTSFTSVRTDADLIQRREDLAAHII